MEELQSKLEEKINPSSILNDDFFLRAEPFIFTSLTPVLLDWSEETSFSSLSFSSIEINKQLPTQVHSV